jgi:hypothetical protein
MLNIVKIEFKDRPPSIQFQSCVSVHSLSLSLNKAFELFMVPSPPPTTKGRTECLESELVITGCFGF